MFYIDIEVHMLKEYDYIYNVTIFCLKISALLNQSVQRMCRIEEVLGVYEGHFPQQ